MSKNAMKPDKKARQYAQALFNLARQTDSIIAVRESLSIVAHLLKKDAIFRVFFYSAKMQPVDKAAILNHVLRDNSQPIVAEFFRLLAERKEWKLFIPTLRAYQQIQRSAEDVIAITAYAANELEASSIREIEESLVERLRKPVDLSTIVEPKLLGGLKLRIGNLFVDGSLETRLKQLRHNLLQT